MLIGPRYVESSTTELLSLIIDHLSVILTRYSLSFQSLVYSISRNLIMLIKAFLLATLLPLAFADVQFTSPAAGATLAAASPIAIKWKDSGDGIALTDLTTYTLFLCAGGNDAASFVSTRSPAELTALPDADMDTGTS